MSKREDGGAAFPHEADYVRGDKPGDPYQFKVAFHPGMSLRDWLAGQAMAGSAHKVWKDSIVTTELTKNAYEIADAMIAARKTTAD